MAGPAGPQPMGPLQHESIMHQQLAALQQGAVPGQQGMGSEGVAPQRLPQPGMSPQQQQQALATHLQMQASQGEGLVSFMSVTNKQTNKQTLPRTTNRERCFFILS